MEKAGEKTLFAVYKKKDGVNDTCVMRRIRRDARNKDGLFEYRRKNVFEEENFDSVMEFEDLEAGMTIDVRFFIL